jgi:hypothetical protein
VTDGTITLEPLQVEVSRSHDARWFVVTFKPRFNCLELSKANFEALDATPG